MAQATARLESPASGRDTAALRPPGFSAGPSAIGVGSTQCPTPASNSFRQGNFSPGSFLRLGATSECARMRSARITCRPKMFRHSAITCRICASGKSE